MGWYGINVDLDQKSIALFNYARKRDYNVNIAISDKKGQADLFFYHDMFLCIFIQKYDFI